jgi:hypothetical protein
VAIGEASAAAIDWPKLRRFQSLVNANSALRRTQPETPMLNQRRHALLRPESAERRPLSIGAMPYAKRVAAEFEKLQTGYRNGLYEFIGKALTSYRKFLRDPDGYKALLSQDNIAGLREKPKLKTTSRLVVYFLIDAQNAADRNTAGKYARIVDYLHKECGDAAAAADHVRNAGGIDAILKKVRGREALQQDDDRRFDEDEKPRETRTAASASGNGDDEDLFDMEKDLSIRVGSETLERVLGLEMDMIESFYLECRKTGPVGLEGVRIVGRLFDPESARPASLAPPFDPT